MKLTSGSSKKIENKKKLAKFKSIVLCKHCKKSIDQAKLIGFSLICPLCKKPQNGHVKI